MRIVLMSRHEIDESWGYISERLSSLGHDVSSVSNRQVKVDDIPPDADAILIDFDANASEALNLTNAIKTDNRFGWTLVVGVTNTDNETLAGLAEEGVVDGMLIATRSQTLVAMQLAFLQQRISEDQRRRELLETVSRQERRVEAILETSPDAIVTCVEDGTITDANRAAIEMFGYSKDQLCRLTN
jgi:PAS domain-containing protein